MPISPVPPSGRNQKSRFPGLTLDEKNISAIVTGYATQFMIRNTPMIIYSYPRFMDF